MDKEKISKVLVLGDSFSEFWPPPDDKNTHWLNLLRYYFNWDLINLSKSGSGLFTAVDQLLNYKDDFDLCIALYSSPDRLYHTDVTDLNHGTALVNIKNRQPDFKNYQYVYEAAATFYTYFADIRLNSLKGIGLHELVDEHISKKYPNKMFIHFDCFPLHKEKEKYGVKSSERIYYKFKHGLTMYPSLFYMSNTDKLRPADMSTDRRYGHLSNYQHIEIFNHIKNIIEQDLYCNDNIYIYSNDFTQDEVIVGLDEFTKLY